MPLLNINSDAGASTTTTSATTTLVANTAVQFFFVNYSPKPAKVFFSASTGTTLSDDVVVGSTHGHIQELNRGVLVEGGEGFRVSVTPTTVATGGTITVTGVPVHTASEAVELGVTTEAIINANTI